MIQAPAKPKEEAAPLSPALLAGAFAPFLRKNEGLPTGLCTSPMHVGKVRAARSCSSWLPCGLEEPEGSLARPPASPAGGSGPFPGENKGLSPELCTVTVHVGAGKATICALLGPCRSQKARKRLGPIDGLLNLDRRSEGPGARFQIVEVKTRGDSCWWVSRWLLATARGGYWALIPEEDLPVLGWRSLVQVYPSCCPSPREEGGARLLDPSQTS